jgi:nicotinate-nucleotide adenylyltransferase
MGNDLYKYKKSIGDTMGKNVIAVFGGSFNPPANSHISLAKQVLENNSNIEKVIFVPVNVKYNKEGLASNEDRFFMLQKICENNEGIEVSDIEITSQRQLYTIETLRLIQEKYKEYEIYFVLGTDNLKELETWHEADELLKKFKMLVLERGDDDIEQIIEEDDFLRKYKTSFIKLQNIEKINLSSTEIRDKVKRGESVTDLVPFEIMDKVIKLYK